MCHLSKHACKPGRTCAAESHSALASGTSASASAAARITKSFTDTLVPAGKLAARGFQEALSAWQALHRYAWRCSELQGRLCMVPLS